MKYAPLFLILILFSNCQNAENQSGKEEAMEGGKMWRGVISLNDSVDVPFHFEWKNNGETFEMTIRNAEERIEVSDIQKIGDSLKIQMPVFANYLMVKKSGGKMIGFFINPDVKNYRLSFQAEANKKQRFPTDEKPCCEINEKWAVQFSPDTQDEYPAIAYFNQNENHVAGTFETETGDYRYLEGVLSGEHLRLSTFDGAHLFYFNGKIENGQKIIGRFYSGRRWTESWLAYRDDDFELRDSDSLTYLKEGFETVNFSIPDAEGKTISLSDERFQNKPVIVQILGSWCPNCMDETRYLSGIYDEYHDEGLEIVGLAFERSEDSEKAWERVQKMKEDLQIPYPVLLAGRAQKEEAAKALPMLNHVMSYPTSIYLWPDHSVKKIHTGFAGPGTPSYEKYVAKDRQNIREILIPQVRD